MHEPWILDLFCGAGGASMGYWRAGFEVVGVDIEPQPDYPFEFIRADAMDVLNHVHELGDFVAVHASPPCQHYSKATSQQRHIGKQYPDLIPAVRDKLLITGLPYVIENVMGAPLNNAIKLCGSMFNLPIQRHRLFEGCVPDYRTLPKCQHKRQRSVSGPTVSVFGHPGLRLDVDNSTDAWREAMGINWMTADSLAQAIPPAYTQFIAQSHLLHEACLLQAAHR